MSRNIPFFEFFAELPASPELRLRLAGAELTRGRIDRKDLSIQLDMTVKSPLAPEALHSLEETLKAVYGFQRAELNVTCTAPPPPAPGHAPQGGGPPKAAPKKKAGKILMGNPIKAKPGPMSALNVKMGTATVSGKVFAFECRETRRPGMWRLSFDMTDGTGSATVQKNLSAREAQALEGAVKPGMWLVVQGKMEPTWDGKDIQLNPQHINVTDHEERMDTAPVKRVELHLHTRMSNMDALTDTKEVIQEAIRWGHPAIAITDHGVAQSFPEAWHAAGDKIKVLYGVEGYFINNVDDRRPRPPGHSAGGGNRLLRY